MEQIAILWQHVCENPEVSLKFVRDHALAIVQLSDQGLDPGASVLTNPLALAEEETTGPQS